MLRPGGGGSRSFPGDKNPAANCTHCSCTYPDFKMASLNSRLQLVINPGPARIVSILDYTHGR